ncbi:MAG: hypothetical protein NTW30_00690 [Candidatus Aenigmarchaeota archaeon]|nr:hypothetical protein [Candidatus Aenigmarchaeota archaeon]
MSFYSIKSVTGQSGGSQNTTVNITVGGNLDKIIVDYFPVNFTLEDSGIAPGTDDNKKQNNQTYLNVSIGGSTNVRWNVSINATNMTDGMENSIPVNEIKVSYSCHTDGVTIDYIDKTGLAYTPLYLSCENGGKTGLASNGYIYVNFFLDVPGGQYNSTYNGDIWLHATSSEAMGGYNESTWYGPNNTTAKIKTRIDIKWTLTPINFGFVVPGYHANATNNQGWPTNITIGKATNVPVDLYINGSDLTSSGIPDTIDSHNITYSNAANETEWPFPYVHTLNNTLPDDSTNGDFANWGNISRDTNVYSYWEITQVPNVPGGDYSGNVVAKAVEAGNDPTPSG